MLSLKGAPADTGPLQKILLSTGIKEIYEKEVRLTEDMMSQIAPEDMITDEEEDHVEQDRGVVQYIGDV